VIIITVYALKTFWLRPSKLQPIGH